VSVPARILRIALRAPLRMLFDYLPPEDCPDAPLQPGIRLRVPFGGRPRIGILVTLADHSEIPAERLKQALEILDDRAVLGTADLELLCWASRYYQHPPGEVIFTALPAALRQGRKAETRPPTHWRLSEAGRQAAARPDGRAPRQAALLQHFVQAGQPGLDHAALATLEFNWRPTLKRLLDKGWLMTADTPVTPSALSLDAAPELNAGQDHAVQEILASLGRFAPILLEGITGSGKTEVYFQVIDALLRSGRQVLVLIPEIALSAQTLQRFRRRFSTRIAVLHSGLGERERLDAWLAARDDHAGIIIGTRSAVWTPMAAPGLIIVDEEHDPSYKQQDGFRYSARDIAVVRARELRIPIILGSATPSLESLQNARLGRYRHLCLPQRAGAALQPTLEILDLRNQPLSAGLSRPLLERMGKHLQRGEQVLLFLNRRGYSPVLLCHHCGWAPQCRNCDSHMTYHRHSRSLRCHHCDAIGAVPASCPECDGTDLLPLGQGTERLEEYLRERFPGAGIARMDRDNTRRQGSLERILQDIHTDKVDILIGTQMLAKGHHFPRVTLVGIVDADDRLYSADFRAGERLAQLIVQVAGRAGRETRPGHVLIQTHHPDHPLLSCLVRQGYSSYAGIELAQRREAGLPPWTIMAMIRAEGHDPEQALAFLRQTLALAAHAATAGIELLGPFPAPMARRGGRYRAQLVLQAGERRRLQNFLPGWIQAIEALPQARRLRWSIDIDPQEMF